MTLMNWTRPETSGWMPFWHLSNLREEIDRLFESPLAEMGRTAQQFVGNWGPAVDVYEDKDSVLVRAELPGMKKENIDLTLQEGVLTISGERKETGRPQEATVYRSERLEGRFQRSLTLPAPVNADKVSATYLDGVLTVTLPKTEESKPKQIAVKFD